jgi:acetyl esterase/lipase
MNTRPPHTRQSGMRFEPAGGPTRGDASGFLFQRPGSAPRHSGGVVLCLVVAVATFAGRPSPAIEHRTIVGIQYRPTTDESDTAAERCRLDLHVPVDATNFPTVVWFHGGGLTKGEREVPKALRERGFAVVGAGYRLSPSVKAATCIDDAAAAVAWTFRSIPGYGGALDRIYVSGHSAGGYLAAMVGLDKRWLATHGIDADHLAGIVPYSGQCITHFTIRSERGIPERQPLIDEFAPLYHVRRDAPPLLLITGDRNREMLGRYEENAYLWRMMKVVGHTRTRLEEIDGQDHGGMVEPAHPLLIDLIVNDAGNAQGGKAAAGTGQPAAPVMAVQRLSADEGGSP